MTVVCFRLFWLLCIVLGIAFATYVCTTTVLMFLRDPTVTTLDPQEYSVYNEPFPAVAVCSNNKFSHQAIRNYALNIALHNQANNSSDYWKNRLEMLSALYNFDSVDFDEAILLHNDLESMFGEKFNTRNVLEMLAPKCEHLLLKCFWAGKMKNCLEEFHLKTFIDGPCCVFNYHYKKDPKSLYYPNSTGHEKGLELLLNASTGDYFYAEDSSNGFNIKIFSTQRIPDTTMGEMEEFHVDPGEDVNVKLHLITQQTMEDVRSYSVPNRGCYFLNEHKETIFDRSECLLKCKIRTTASICQCIPFYATKSDIEFTKNYEDMEQCSLFNLGCLDKYRMTWITYFPTNADTNSHLKDKLLDSLKCPDCFPLCSFNRYFYRKTANKLKHTFKRNTNRKLLGNISAVAEYLSVVKIYYPFESGTRYQKKLLFNWYGILSNIGGVIGICVGCSIISGIEIIYFGIFRLRENYFKIQKNKN